MPVSSIKSMIGHGLGAAGSLEFAACLLALRDQMIPATVSCQEPMAADETIDLITVPRNSSVASVMSNSFAFAGNTATLICRALA